MTDNQLIASAKRTAARVVSTITKKNKDYAGPEDLYANFRSSSLLKLGVEKALLVRTLDKIVRIDNLIDHEAYVADEPLEESIDDVIGYMMILRGFRETLPKQKRKRK